MRGLAEFVMRGRLQALLVAVACAGAWLFCWISAAVVALVTLRKGAGQGAWLLLWALLPAGLTLYAYGDSGPLVLLVGTTALAMVLRGTVSLALAVLASVAVGFISGAAALTLGAEYVQQLATYFGQFLATIEQQLADGGNPVQLPRPSTGQIAGMLGAGSATTAVLCLLLARYWQAALYNPGGFGEEFRALYYPVAVSMALALGAVALSAMGMQFRSWAMICFIPLTFAGLALVHARAQARGQGAGWLGVFYATWFVFDPVKLVVVFFALADSWMNFRERWAQQDAGAPALRDDSDAQDPGREDDNDEHSNERNDKDS